LLQNYVLLELLDFFFFDFCCFFFRSLDGAAIKIIFYGTRNPQGMQENMAEPENK